MVEILICDDSVDYAQLLEFKLKKCLDDFDTDGHIVSIHSLEELNKILELKRYNPDILFLDIMFGEHSSIDWCLENINNETTQIIFMTEFPTEAYNISEVKHSYFLVKSRTTDDILKRALQKGINILTQKDTNLIQVKVGGRSYTVKSNDILYAESMNNNVCLHLADGSDIKIYSTLKQYVASLPPNFLRCHKSYVVNMNHIAAVIPHEFVLKTGQTLPISPRKYSDLSSKYNRYIKA